MTHREELEKEFGQVWDLKQLIRDFLALGHVGRFVTVIRRSDNKKGSLVRVPGVPHFDEESSSFVYEDNLYHSFKED